jgi:hypothetical protein
MTGSSVLESRGKTLNLKWRAGESPLEARGQYGCGHSWVKAWNHDCSLLVHKIAIAAVFISS